MRDANRTSQSIDLQMKILLVLNAKSGKGKAALLAEEFIEEAKPHFWEIVSIDLDSAEKTRAVLKEQLQSGSIDSVIAVGGDGLVHMVIQEVSGSDIVLGVLPAGTGNDFFRESGLGENPVSQLITAISTSSHKRIDTGNIKSGSLDRSFVQILSTGFDSLVNKKANSYKFNIGKFKYTLATLQILLRFKPIEYTVTTNQGVRTLKAMLIAMANGRSYGGGMLISPYSSRDDGIFDVMILHPVSKFELLRVFPKVFKGKHVTHRAVDFIRCKDISLKGNFETYADGEFVTAEEISVSIQTSSLSVWSKE